MLGIGAKMRSRPPMDNSGGAGRPRQSLQGSRATIPSAANRALVSLTVALILFSNTAPAQDEKLYDLYTKAQAAQQAGDFQTAAGHYEELVRLRPELAEVHANLGSIYYQIHDDAKAAAALEKAIQLNPKLTAPHFFLGVVASRQQNYEKAIRHLETSVKLDSSNLIVPFYLGEAYFATRRYADAASSFQKARSLEEFRADAYYYLSKAYGELSKQALDQLDGEDPSSFHMQLARGHFHEGRKSWKEAEKAYDAALKKNPEAVGLEARLQWVSRNAASDSRAGPPPPLPEKEATMLGLLYEPPSEEEIDPMFRAYENRLHQGASVLGDEEKLYRLAEDYQIASYLAARWISKNDPGSYRAHQLRAQLHESRGETDEAVREYRAALRLKPNLQNLHFAIGSLLWSLSRFDEALPELEAELGINHIHPEAHYEIADILQVRGRNAQAKEHLLEALRQKPDLVEAHLAIERIYFAEEQFDQALAHMKSAVRLSPQNPTPHYRMSMLYRKLGKTEEAQKELQEFQRLQER